MKVLSSFILALMVLVISSPVVFAQSDISGTVIKVNVPDQLLIGEDISVSIDVTDAKGLPWDGELPVVTFTPADGVFDDVVFDCVDIDESESCQANNRGVAGVYESVFTLKNSPVTMTVEVDSVSKQVQLIATNSETIIAATPPVPPNPPSLTNPPSPSLTPASIQVGPSPSAWIILIPLALMGIIVTLFVVKTTE